jgi:hypothetical protein
VLPGVAYAVFAYDSPYVTAWVAPLVSAIALAALRYFVDDFHGRPERAALRGGILVVTGFAGAAVMAVHGLVSGTWLPLAGGSIATAGVLLAGWPGPGGRLASELEERFGGLAFTALRLLAEVVLLALVLPQVAVLAAAVPLGDAPWTMSPGFALTALAALLALRLPASDAGPAR